MLECREFDIERAYVLCTENMERKGKIIYAPIYMTMFLAAATEASDVYTIDLSGLQ